MASATSIAGGEFQLRNEGMEWSNEMNEQPARKRSEVKRVEWDKQRKQKQKGYEFIGCVLPSLHSL